MKSMPPMFLLSTTADELIRPLSPTFGGQMLVAEDRQNSFIDDAVIYIAISILCFGFACKSVIQNNPVLFILSRLQLFKRNSLSYYK